MLTKLDAVNRCLRAIGETRVNSLSSGLPDAGEAKTTLEDVTEEVLASGWYENTRHDVELHPDATTKNILISSDWHQVEAEAYTGRKLVARMDPNDNQWKLYDLENDTFKFEGKVKVRVVKALDFNELSYALKNYIAARTARVFQESTLGSVSLDQFTTRAENDAWAVLLSHEAEMAEHNQLVDSPYMREVTHRYNRLTWR